MSNQLAYANLNADTYTPEQLVVGGPVATKPDHFGLTTEMTKLGTVLGRSTVNQLLIPCDPNATDGSEKPVAIAVEDMNTHLGLMQGPTYVGGQFALQGLVWHPNFTTDEQKLAAFGDLSPIIVKKLGYSG